ncbi:MAG: dihydrofolate reductase family protein [Anaerolineae bacterium]
MKKLVVSTLLTLDGVMQAPGDPQEDTEGGFKHGGWARLYSDADIGRVSSEGVAATDALLLGRVTYQIFARSWPYMPKDDPMAKRLNSIPKYVWSKTLDKVEWNNSMLVKGDLTEEVTKLKQQPGSGVLVVTGSGQLARSLMQHDLVDEYVLMVHPLVLGTGKRLFTDGIVPLNLKLVDTKTTGSGIVVLTYQPAGK